MNITHGVPLPAGCMLYLGTNPFLRPKLNSGDLKSFQGLLLPKLFNLHYQLQLSGIHLFAPSPLSARTKFSLLSKVLMFSQQGERILFEG